MLRSSLVLLLIGIKIMNKPKILKYRRPEQDDYKALMNLAKDGERCMDIIHKQMIERLAKRSEAVNEWAERVLDNCSDGTSNRCDECLMRDGEYGYSRQSVIGLMMMAYNHGCHDSMERNLSDLI